MSDRIVTGPVVVLPDGNGLIRYYYQGAVIPDGLDEDRVQAAVDAGLVSDDKDAADLTVEDLSVSGAGDALRARGTDTTVEGTSLVGESEPARRGRPRKEG